MDPNEILKAGMEVVNHAPELAKGAAALIGAFKFTDIAKAMLGPAANEVAERIHDEARLYRYGRQLEMVRKAEKMAKEAGFTPKAVPIKLLFPLLDGASLEEDEDLHTMWAALLANAADPNFSNRVKVAFADVLGKLSSDDAAILHNLAKWIEPDPKKDGPMESTELGMEDAVYYAISEDLNLTYPKNEGNVRFSVPMENLLRLRLLALYPAMTYRNNIEQTVNSHDYKLFMTSFGREFIRACQPPKS